MSILKETLISCSQRAEIAENQTQSLMLQMVEWQCKLNFQPHRVSALKASIGKEWDLENWNGDIWEDPNEARDIEPLNSNEFSLPSEEINSALPENIVMASPEVVVLKTIADSP